MLSLGIDIGDNHITGAVIEQRGRRLSLRGCASLPMAYGADPAETIALLCRQLDWRDGVCVCGLSLSLISVRNLNLPFQDARKIAQVLPAELEEQLLAPVETVVTGFAVAGKREAGGAAIVTLSLEKSWLRALLTSLQGVVDPRMVVPSMASLAAHLGRQDRERPNFLLIHVDLHAGSLALVANGQPTFFRRLPYLEETIFRSPFRYERGQVEIVELSAAMECIRLLCRSAERSLEYFRMENREGGGMADSPPERIVLTGPLAQRAFVTEIVRAEFGLPVEAIDFFAANALACADEVRQQWPGPSGDRALVLALQGLKRTGINFRQGEFAPTRTLFASKKQAMAAAAAGAALALGLAGFLGYDYHQLHQRDAALHQTMVTVYKETFPEATKVQDPLTEMQARMQSLRGPASPSLFLHDGKRVLGLLADISARIPETVVLRVSRLHIDRESLTLKGSTDTFNAVQAIKSALAASPKFKSVQIVSATADKDKQKGLVRFEVQLQLEGL